MHETYILLRGAAHCATVAAIVVVLWIDTTTIEVQIVSIASRERRTRPKETVGSRGQRARRVIVVASVGKVEGSRAEFGGTSSAISNTIGGSDEGGVGSKEPTPLPLPYYAEDGEATSAIIVVLRADIVRTRGKIIAVDN